MILHFIYKLKFIYRDKTIDKNLEITRVIYKNSSKCFINLTL